MGITPAASQYSTFRSDDPSSVTCSQPNDGGCQAALRAFRAAYCSNFNDCSGVLAFIHSGIESSRPENPAWHKWEDIYNRVMSSMAPNIKAQLKSGLAVTMIGDIDSMIENLQKQEREAKLANGECDTKQECAELLSKIEANLQLHTQDQGWERWLSTYNRLLPKLPADVKEGFSAQIARITSLVDAHARRVQAEASTKADKERVEKLKSLYVFYLSLKICNERLSGELDGAVEKFRRALVQNEAGLDKDYTDKLWNEVAGGASTAASMAQSEPVDQLRRECNNMVAAIPIIFPGLIAPDIPKKDF
jgi:hypothetical protein